MPPTPVLPQQSLPSHGLDSQRLNVQNVLTSLLTTIPRLKPSN